MNEHSSIDTQSVETLKGLMKDRFGFLIETFFTNTSKQLEELQAAIDENNTEGIISITHALKGSSGSVGASSMHQLSKIYEDEARTSDLDNVNDWAKILTTEFNRYKVEIQNFL